MGLVSHYAVFLFLNKFESFVMLTFVLQLSQYESHTSLVYFPVLANAKHQDINVNSDFVRGHFNMNDIFYAYFMA